MLPREGRVLKRIRDRPLSSHVRASLAVRGPLAKELDELDHLAAEGIPGDEPAPRQRTRRRRFLRKSTSTNPSSRADSAK